MTPGISTPTFYRRILTRAEDDGPGNLDSWAKAVGVTLGGLDICPRQSPDFRTTLNHVVIERGLSKIQGGQRMSRPDGVTDLMFVEIQMAVSDMDPQMMTPATASAIIQVGLFGRVIYP